MIRPRGVAAGILAAVCLNPFSVHAKVVPRTLDEVIQSSDRIVIGRVREVHRAAGHRAAEVEVKESILGTASPRRLLVLASPTWTCDLSDAKRGEIAIFLLEPATDIPQRVRNAIAEERPGLQMFSIAFSGRGRMPQVLVAGVPYVEVSEMQLPGSLRALALQESSGYTATVPQAAMLEHIRTATRGQ
jgi:hypothetical protein